MNRLAFSLALLCLVATTLAGDVALQESRILRQIDFEERPLGNREDQPMFWTKAKGPGLPHYVSGALARGVVHDGEYAFRLDLNGGSIVYRYDQNPIRVQPGAHYRIDGFVRTTRLTYARARISAYFADADQHPLPNTTVQSPPLVSTAEAPDWREVQVDLSATDPNAAFLIVEVGLLQPAMLQLPGASSSSLALQDITGSAWFDSIVISQVPRVTLYTDRPGNLFPVSQPAVLKVIVNDRNTDDLNASLVITNAEGQVVHQRANAVDMRTAESLAPTEKRMTITLPALPPGWYQVALRMQSQGQFIAEQKLAIAFLADDLMTTRPDPRFGIIATDLPFNSWSKLPALLPTLAAGRVKLGVWNKEGSIQQMAPAEFDHLLEQLRELGITPTACLLNLPPDIAALAHGQGWPALLQTAPEQWNGQLATLISRHANHLDRWQLGADGTDAFVTNPRMRQVYDTIYREFARLVQQPDLAMPWPAWYELKGQTPATIALAVPSSVLPSQLPLYIQDMKSDAGKRLSLSLEPLDPQLYGRERALRDFAQRLIYALAAGADRIDFPLPYVIHQEDGRIVAEPQEALIIARTILQTLGGAQFKGKTPIADDVEAFLFDRNGTGIVVMWDRAATTQTHDVSLNLLRGASLMDLWGNRTMLPPPPSGDNTTSNLAVPIGLLPTFLCGVDAPMAELRSSIVFDRPLLESSFQPHTRKLRFSSPYKTAISGLIKLKAPAGWTITPPSFNFSLNPGEAYERELTIEFPYNSFAGSKSIQAEVTVQGERNSQFVVPISLSLGLADVGMQTLAIRDGKEVVVQQVITNYSSTPIDYTAFSTFPGQARQERLVSGLAPGRSTIKRYRFIAPTLDAQTFVRSGIKEINGTRILNEQVPIQ